MTTPHSFGIVEKLPNHIRLTQIVQSLPKECFKKNALKAWTALATNVALVAVAYFAIAFAPWYLLPFAWFFAGTALTGFFVLGHDCAHGSFSNSRRLNSTLGHLLFLPLLYPFHPWRIQHNRHHLYTNKKGTKDRSTEGRDNAWVPYTREEFEKLSSPAQFVYKYFQCGKMWWCAAALHQALLHFVPRRFKREDYSPALFSIVTVLAFMAVFFPLLYISAGIWGLVSFWLIPWLVFQFWMSTFTIIHHVHEEIGFKQGSDWQASEAQLSGTVHCRFPRWIEWMTHDINVHIPHHVSTAIPSYNLRMAHKSLETNWGPYLRRTKFSWNLMWSILARCQLHHEEHKWERFHDEGAVLSVASNGSSDFA